MMALLASLSSLAAARDVRRSSRMDSFAEEKEEEQRERERERENEREREGE